MKKLFLLYIAVILPCISALGQVDSLKVDTDSLEVDKKKGLPLKAGRKIKMEVNEGSWISVDVSPDGRTIVFDLLGDLYLLPMTGGKAKQLTEGMAYDVLPKFSPDGKKVLFISDRSGRDNIWTIDLGDKKTNQITLGNLNDFQSADWAPNGRYIVASQGKLNLKLHLYHVDGGKGLPLIKEPENLKTVEPTFSADGRYIWYAYRKGAWNYNASLPQYQIAVYDQETGEITPKTNRYGSAFSPTLSPDGQWLVYGTRYNDKTGLIVRNLTTGNERWLAYPVQRDEQESIAPLGVLPAMSFTPNSENLLVSYGGKIYRLPIDGGAAVPIPFEVDTEIEIGPRLKFDYPITDDKMMPVTQIRDVVVSPDKKRIAFTALNKLYIQDLAGGEARRVTDFKFIEAMPAWSPDGNYLAFTTWDGNDGGSLYKVKVTGKGKWKPQQLTKLSAMYTQPSWSFKGDKIVFMKGNAQNVKDAIGPIAFGLQSEIAWVASEGGEINVIDAANGRSQPHFVKSDDRVYLYSSDKGLVSIRLDGSDQKELVKVSGIVTYGFGMSEDDHHILGESPTAPERKPSKAALVKMAPEGDQALALINNEVYTLTVPKLGGKAIEMALADVESAAFPAKKLTKIGGQFPSWSADAKLVYWSIGNAFFSYDLEEAARQEEKMKNNDKEVKEKAEKESKKDTSAYKPMELRVVVNVPRDIPSGAILLQNARIITMNGNEIIKKGDIYIENNRIRQVGKSGSILVNDGVRKMDVAGKTIIPGFVDTHAHMRPLWGIHKDQVWQYTANLAYGVTTTRDPQTGTTDVLTYADMVDAGEMIGPRVYSTGPGVGFWAYNIRDLDHARDVLKQYSEYYNTKTIKMYLTGNRQQRQWIVMAAKEQGLMPTTEGALNFKLNMTQVIDGYPGHEHSFPIYPLYKDVIDLVSESQTTYTPTLLVSYGGPWAENYYYATEDVQGDNKMNHFTPKSELDKKSRRRNAGWFMKEEYVFEDHAVFVKDLVAAGGKAGVGSHGQLQGLGYHWELWSVQSGGLSEHDALKVATIHGAEAIGLSKDLGSIEKGKLADLIVLDKNPLDNIRNSNSINMVMKNGRLYKGASLEEVYPIVKKVPVFNWRQSVPDNIPGIGE